MSQISPGRPTVEGESNLDNRNFDYNQWKVPGVKSKSSIFSVCGNTNYHLFHFDQKKLSGSLMISKGFSNQNVKRRAKFEVNWTFPFTLLDFGNKKTSPGLDFCGRESSCSMLNKECGLFVIENAIYKYV